MTSRNDFGDSLPLRPWRPRTRRERFLAWLDSSHEVGRLIEWSLVLAVILGLVSFVAAVSKMDGDLDVAAKLANDQDARVRSVICAEAK